MAVIVFGCIASGGWLTSTAGKEQCLFNGSSGTCTFATVIGVFAFLACIILIAIGMTSTLVLVSWAGPGLEKFLKGRAGPRKCGPAHL